MIRKGLTLEKGLDQNNKNWKIHKHLSIASIFFSAIAAISVLIFPFAYYTQMGWTMLIVPVTIWAGPPPTRSFLLVILLSFLWCVLISISWLLSTANKNHSLVNPLRICLVIFPLNSFVLTVIFASIVHLFCTGGGTFYAFGSLYTSIACSFILFILSLIQYKYPVIAIRTGSIFEKEIISNSAPAEI